MESGWTTSPTPSVGDMIDSAPSPDNILTAGSSTKRKRASKPKVRTGCITCKIRRVKCDETKPACTRCTSTGRKCDGYEGTPPPRARKPASSSSPSPLAPPFFAMTDSHLGGGPPRSSLAPPPPPCPGSGGSKSRTLRPLAADIEGTEEERLFFHRFRQAAEAGLALHASSLGTSFWRRLVPQVGNSDPAVRHALIALGAAYESMQLQQQHQQQQQQQQGRQGHEQNRRMRAMPQQGTPGAHSRGGSPSDPRQPYVSTPPPEDTYQCVDQLELFMIQQYNLSIYHLQRHVQPGSPPESVEITLICCLVFVCIETSRGNESAALAHVANGLQIIKALPEGLDPGYLPHGPGSGGGSSDGIGGRSSAGTANYLPPRISRSDWRQLLEFFLALEPNATTHGFTSNQSPNLPYPSTSTWEHHASEWSGEMAPHWEHDTAETGMRN